MKSRVLGSLLLACSLPLALPQGWCCIFASHPAAIAKAPAEQANCCDCCGHGKHSSSPAKPANHPHRRCPCSDRQTVLLASHLAKADFGLGLNILVPPSDALAHRLTHAIETISAAHPPSLRLHRFKCVWLC